MDEESGSSLLVECLENEGVKHIFGIPGEQTVPVMEELRKSEIEFVVTRHEQGAAFMADVYGRLSDSCGVCLSTLGPGATNLITGVGNANLDHSPVVALTSQRKTLDQHKHSHQFVDTSSLFESVTQRTDVVRHPETIPEQVRKSFEVATRERKGATHLDLPYDTTQATASASPLETSENTISPSGVQQQNIEKALEHINKADNPVIIAGNAILSQNASDQFTRLVNRTRIPVVTTFMGKGAISHENDHHVGVIGFDTDDYPMHAVKQADMVVTVGYDYIEFHPDSWNVGGDKTIIHVDNTEPEIDEYYGTEMTLVGNIRRILEQFNEHVDGAAQPTTYAKTLRERYLEQREEEYAENDAAPFTPQQVVAAIRAAANRDDTVITDVGAHKYWFSRLYPTYEPNTFLVSNGFASMGIALPGVIAADLVTETNAIAVAGDGGALMNIQELETISRLDVSPTIIVLDDKEYTAITMEQEDQYQQTHGASFHNPDFSALAESFGLEAYEVTDSRNLESTLRDAVESNSASLVSVPISPNESYKLEAD